MSVSLRLAIASLFVVFATRDLTATPLVNLVDEKTALVVSIQDVPVLLKNWEQSPWARTWNDEQVKKFLAPMRAQMKLDEWDEQCKAECGYTVAELVAMAKGQALVALADLDFVAVDAKPSPSDLPLIIALEIGDNAEKIAKIVAANDEKEHSVVRTEEFAGVNIHVYTKSEEKGASEDFTWAMADGIWLLSPSKAMLQKTIDSLQKGGSSSSLGSSERYLKIKKETGNANVTFLANMPVIYPAIQKAVEARSAESGSQPLGLAPSAILASLGLDALNDIYFSFDVGGDATEFKGGLTYSELRGALKLLAYRDGPVAQPDFVSAKWITVSSLRFSLLDAYKVLRELVNNLSPAIGAVVDGQIKGLNKQLGVDLERDLFGSLGEDIVVANATRPGASAEAPVPLTEFDQLYAFSLKNSAAFADAVEALKRMAGPQADKLFEKREYLNQTIYTYGAAASIPGQKGFSYSITPKFLFIAAGTPAVIETALQGLDGKQPIFWQQPEVKEALADVPSKASTFQFQNTRAMVGSLIETFIQMAPLFAAKAKPESSDDGDDEKPAGDSLPFDLSSKPDGTALGKYWSTSSGYAWRESNGLYFQSKLKHAK